MEDSSESEGTSNSGFSMGFSAASVGDDKVSSGTSDGGGDGIGEHGLASGSLFSTSSC